MLMAENLNRSKHQMLIISIKFLPIVIAVVYLVNTILFYVGIDVPYLSLLGGTSILTVAFMYICSAVFKFCLYHRLFIHYILVNDLLNWASLITKSEWLDTYLFRIVLITTALFIFLITYIHVKSNKRTTSKNNK